MYVFNMLQEFGIVLTCFFGLYLVECNTDPDRVVHIAGARVLIYESTLNSTSMLIPATVYIHGGAWVGGKADISPTLNLFADVIQRSKLFSIDYILGSGFPSEFQENLKVIKYLLHHGQIYGIDSNKIIVMGGSAGGNIAAGISHELKSIRFQPRLEAQILLSPALQATDFNTSSYIHFGSNDNNRMGMIGSWAHYWKPTVQEDELIPIYENKHQTQDILNNFREMVDSSGGQHSQTDPTDAADRRDTWNKIKDVFGNPQFAPLMTTSFVGLPKTVIYAGHELLTDDSVYYTYRLRQAGVEVDFILDPQGHHGSAYQVGADSSLLRAIRNLYDCL